jgi:hypothetical protein
MKYTDSFAYIFRYRCQQMQPVIKRYIVKSLNITFIGLWHVETDE